MLPTQRSTYRPDIDGLRSLAVLPVLLYHARVPAFSGGYIGVDVFFVISGFLITGILAREIDSGSFSLWTFYERRARRILPALFAVILFVLIGAGLLYFPGDFEGVPKSALAALFFLANVWFFSETNYFQGGSETMPLLHTWSLGVEEQFYILFPLALWFMAKYSRDKRVMVICALTIASFIWAYATQGGRSGFAFYMLPTRAWELLVGSLLALGVIPAIHSRIMRETLALAGVGAITAATLLYSHETVFPGLAALPPVIGAALLIQFAPGTRIGAILSMRLPVFIGVISYSLYLWHWPLIVFTEYAQGAPLSPFQTPLLIGISILIAWLSWKFIEAPFRSKARFDRRKIFQWSAIGMAGLSAIPLAMIAQGGWSSRFSPQVAQLAAAKHDFSPKRAACMTKPIEQLRKSCVIGADVPPTAMVWGDSHSVEFAWVLGQEMTVKGQSLTQRSRGSCPPIARWESEADPLCAPFNREVMQEILSDENIRRVYLSGFWESEAYQSPETLDQLEATIARLIEAEKDVVFIGPVPSQNFEVPRQLAKAALLGNDPAKQETRSAETYLASVALLRQRFPAWQAKGVIILDPAKALVDGKRTVIVKNGKALYLDSHHLSVAGAKLVVEANRNE